MKEAVKKLRENELYYQSELETNKNRANTNRLNEFLGT